MKQEKIMELLREAASSKCSIKRRNLIQIELVRATAAVDEDGTTIIEGREAGISTLIGQLFHDTLVDCPAYLPKLFPVFAMACGNRGKEMITSAVEWSLIFI